MGLVRKVKTESVATGSDGSIDISSLIRQAVSAEIERRNQEKVEPAPLRPSEVDGPSDDAN
jgi:hypothetical protein